MPQKLNSYLCGKVPVETGHLCSRYIWVLVYYSLFKSLNGIVTRKLHNRQKFLTGAKALRSQNEEKSKTH